MPGGLLSCRRGLDGVVLGATSQNVADILVEPEGSLHKETTAPPPRQEHLAVLRQPMPGFAVAELAPAFPEIRGSTGNERKVLLRPSLSKSVFT